MLVQGYFYSGEKRILEVSYPSRLTVNTACILDLWSVKPFVYTYSEVHTQKKPTLHSSDDDGDDDDDDDD